MRSKLTYANVISTLCLFLLLGGGAAFAAGALPKNSVGTKQLKNSAVTGQKVALHTLTGENLDISTLGTVPSAVHSSSADVAGTATHASTADSADHATSATHATSADSATTADMTHADTAAVAEKIAGFEIGCPSNTTLIRGVCFDAASNSAAKNLKEAADSCAAKGGFLPTPMELYATRGVLNLGTGVGSDHQYTDEFYANTTGTSYSTVVIDGTGAVTEQSVSSPSQYICAYALVR